AAGTKYYYKAKAYTSSTSSAFSNVASDIARGAATHFQVTASSTTVTAGTAFTVTVDALDSYNNIAVGYAATASFSSTDARAALPANYTFTSGDLGVHSSSATLNTAGTQLLTCTDIATTTITGTQSNITVSAAAVSTGAAYYVSTTGSDSNSGALTAPFQ